MKNKETIKDFVLDGVKDGSINLEEITKYGCINGCVSALIYYEDTTKFYIKHEKEIWEMLREDADNCGVNVMQFITSLNGQDTVSEPYLLYNLLSWYAVENVASNLLAEEENREVA